MLGKLVDEGGVLWLDTGEHCYAGVNRFRVVMKDDRFLAAKRPGRKYWGGIGMAQGYAPASFDVYECVHPDDPNDPESFWTQCLSIPLRP